METLIEYDRWLLLALNGSESLYLDAVVKTLTTAATWIPLYLALFYLVMRNNNSVTRIFAIVGCAAVCYLLAGAVDDGLVKPLVARWRPTHDPVIGWQVDVVNGYRGGNYGFFSAHASNTFSIAVFFSLLVRSRLLSVSLILWSLVNCWTRLYLGVHFPCFPENSLQKLPLRLFSDLGGDNADNRAMIHDWFTPLASPNRQHNLFCRICNDKSDPKTANLYLRVCIRLKMTVFQ